MDGSVIHRAWRHRRWNGCRRTNGAGGASLTAANTFAGVTQTFSTGALLQVGLSTDASNLWINGNQLSFNRSTGASYINMNGVGQTLIFKTSAVTSGDTTAMSLSSTGLTVYGVLNVNGAISPTTPIAIAGGGTGKQQRQRH